MSTEVPINSLKAEIVKALEKNTARDYVSVALKSGFSNLPSIGGAIVELIDLYIPESKSKRLLQFVADLRIDVDKLKDKIKKDFVKTDEFAYLFEQTFRAVYDNYQREKLSAFRALLVNSMVRTDVAAEQKELLLGTLETLSTIHLRFLGMLNDPRKYVAENKISISENISVAGTIRLLREIFPMYEDSQIRTVINDLYSAGLITLASSELGVGATWGMQMVENRFTPQGKALIQFITLQ